MQIQWKKFADALVTKALRLGRRAYLEVTSATGTITRITNEQLATLNSAARLVTLAVTTTLTAALHAGRNIIMTGAGGARTFTLPAATGSGDTYTFIVGEVNTSNYLIKVADGTDTIDGTILNVDGDSTDATRGFKPVAADDTITLNGTTSGGASIGDWIVLTDIAANQWALRGLVTGSGVVITPFSATVS